MFYLPSLILFLKLRLTYLGNLFLTIPRRSSCSVYCSIAVVQLLSHVRLCDLVDCSMAGLTDFSISWSLLKLVYIDQHYLINNFQQVFVLLKNLLVFLSHVQLVLSLYLMKRDRSF